jgi:hypothetical protein
MIDGGLRRRPFCAGKAVGDFRLHRPKRDVNMT